MKIDFISDINKGYESVMSYAKLDGFIIKVLWLHFIFIVVLAITNSYLRIAEYFPNPFSWRVITIPEASYAMLIAFLAVLIPAFLRGKIQNHYAWRILVTFALTIYSYLIVFLSGGSIEMHFHFFIIITLLIIYSDWRLGWITLVLTGLHHGILNYAAPTWVYFYGRNDFSVIAHALPVLVAVIFTTIICQNNRRSIISMLLAIKK